MAAADVELIPKVCIKFIEKNFIRPDIFLYKHTYIRGFREQIYRIVLRNSNEIYSFRELLSNAHPLSILP